MMKANGTFNSTGVTAHDHILNPFEIAGDIGIYPKLKISIFVLLGSGVEFSKSVHGIVCHTLTFCYFLLDCVEDSINCCFGY